METVWSDEVDAIFSVGIFLGNVGVRNWAIPHSNALAVLDRLADIGVGVLGGDVYLKREGTIELSYDNWYCNPEITESDKDFVNRSISYARTYVANYRAAPPNDIFFAFVPNVKQKPQGQV